MTRPAHRAELVTSDTVVLVSVTYAGRAFRFSDRTVQVLQANGDAIPFDGGLASIDIEESIDALGLEAEFASLPVSVVFPVDVAALVQQGHDLAAATAEVALHVVGQVWEDRELIIDGQLVEPDYAEEGTPTHFSVEANPFDDAGLTIPAGWVVTPTTWPTSTVSGSPYYPWPFGRPGAWLETDGSENVVAGSPAIIVEYTGANVDTLLISSEAVASTDVKIYDGTTTETFTTVVESRDALGQACAVVDITGAASISRTASEYWVLWSAGGAAYTVDRSAVMDGAGDVMARVLSRSTAPLDRSRFESIRPILNQYKVAGYINAAVRPWTWVQDHLLPILPVSMVGGAQGAYPVMWPLRATAADAVDTLTEGDEVTRIGGAPYLRHPRNVYDEIRLRYARGAGPDSGLWGGRIVLGLSPVEDDSAAGFSVMAADSFVAQTAARRVANRDPAKAERVPRTMTLDTEVVYDRPTAFRIAHEQLQAAASSVRQVQYLCARHYRWIRPGHVVLLVDAGLHLSSQVAVVVGRHILSTGKVLLTTQIWELPARDVRSLA